jgi:hypothetical protein
MNENWVDHELKNWSRWCNSGAMPHPYPFPGSCLDGLCVPELLTDAGEDLPPPIHEENAKKVQKVFDVAVFIERKVMQAEYLSPWKYGRYSGGIAAAARALDISPPSYETILTVVKRRVEQVFT